MGAAGRAVDDHHYALQIWRQNQFHVGLLLLLLLLACEMMPWLVAQLTSIIPSVMLQCSHGARQAYAKEIREGCIRGYSQSSKRWVAQAEKYAKKHDAIHLRPKPWSEDGADGDGRGEGEEEQGQEQERVKRDPSDLLGDMGPVGGGLKKSGRVVSRREYWS